MAVENPYHHDDAGKNSLAIALIAILVIAAIAVFALRILPMQNYGSGAADDDTNSRDINVETPDAPAMNAQ